MSWVILVSVVLILVSSLLFSLAEKIPFGSSVWWAIVTTTTVGYGDIAPTTFVGRCIATVLMITGIGVVGIITSAITNYFSKSNQESDNNRDRIDKVLDELKELKKNNERLNYDLKKNNKILNDKIDKLQKK